MKQVESPFRTPTLSHVQRLSKPRIFHLSIPRPSTYSGFQQLSQCPLPLLNLLSRTRPILQTVQTIPLGNYLKCLSASLFATIKADQGIT